MDQDDKPESMDNKVDALAAMADGQDIAKEGFNAIDDIPAETGQNDAAAAFVAQSASAESGAPVISTAETSGARRKSRASALQKQQAHVHAEQFKRMMVPILLVTGILLLLLGGIVMFLMRQAPADAYTGSGALNNPNLKRIMVITSFPLGAILLLGAWLFRADIKRGQAADQRANAKDEGSEG